MLVAIVDMNPLPDTLDIAKSIVQDLKNDLVKLAQYTIDDLGRLVDENARQQLQARVYDSNFYEVVKCANLFIARAEDLFELCSGENSVQCIKEKIDNGQLNRLNDFFRQFHEILSDCEKRYKLCVVECQRVQINCTEAKAQCERQAIEAETKRNNMQVVGNAAAGGLLATATGASASAACYMLSILAGPLTLGTSTVAALLVTAGVAGTAGMGGFRTALSTEYNGDQYDELASRLRQNANIMDQIHKHTISLSYTLITSKGEIERKETILSDQEKRYQYIKTHRLSYKIKTGTCHILNLLQILILNLDLKEKINCIICIVLFCVWLYFCH